MPILPDTIEAIESGAHCWVTIPSEYDKAFQMLLTMVTARNQFSYTPVAEVHLHGLSDVQQAELIQRRENLIYRDRHGAVFVLIELWDEVEEAVAQAAPSAAIQRRIAVSLRFADPHMVEKLRTELRSHPVLNYVEIDFGED